MIISHFMILLNGVILSGFNIYVLGIIDFKLGSG